VCVPLTDLTEDAMCGPRLEEALGATPVDRLSAFDERLAHAASVMARTGFWSQLAASGGSSADILSLASSNPDSKVRICRPVLGHQGLLFLQGYMGHHNEHSDCSGFEMCRSRDSDADNTHDLPSNSAQPRDWRARPDSPHSSHWDTLPLSDTLLWRTNTHCALPLPFPCPGLYIRPAK
jgi:hypothetical protein